MMEFYEMLNNITNLVDGFVADNTQSVKPEAIGLDRRVAYELFISEDLIVGSKDKDRDLQYVLWWV